MTNVWNISSDELVALLNGYVRRSRPQGAWSSSEASSRPQRMSGVGAYIVISAALGIIWGAARLALHPPPWGILVIVAALAALRTWGAREDISRHRRWGYLSMALALTMVMVTSVAFAWVGAVWASTAVTTLFSNSN